VESSKTMMVLLYVLCQHLLNETEESHELANILTSDRLKVKQEMLPLDFELHYTEVICKCKTQS
jgi:hypothetical protein